MGLWGKNNTFATVCFCSIVCLPVGWTVNQQFHKTSQRKICIKTAIFIRISSVRLNFQLLAWLSISHFSQDIAQTQNVKFLQFLEKISERGEIVWNWYIVILWRNKVPSLAFIKQLESRSCSNSKLQHWISQSFLFPLH